MNTTKNVLVIADYYLPGYKGGGPIKSLNGLMSALGGDIKFKLITRCHDLGDQKPFDIPLNNWTQRKECSAYYSTSAINSMIEVGKLLRAGNVETIYLNSYFSPSYSLIPLALVKVFSKARVSCILAPRGELGSGALNIKKFKKMFFISLSRNLAMHKNVLWHVTSDQELNDVSQHYGTEIRYFLSSNIVNYEQIEETWAPSTGRVKIVFLSRLVVKKNLKTAILSLRKTSCSITLHIYGPKEDLEYWQECEGLLASLPANIEWKYCGNVAGEKTRAIFEKYDLFLFPSLNENFGHVIAEALSVGCAVITSNQTPWLELQQAGIGWIVEPDNISDICNCVIEYSNLNLDEKLALRSNIKKYFRHWMKNQSSISVARNAFLSCDSEIG